MESITTTIIQNLNGQMPCDGLFDIIQKLFPDSLPIVSDGHSL